ncbi:MAG: lysylphosphatidylglycerol synthase domain-containing protein [Bacteroidetes bacterium]|nr:lysylphosphatidylglycerol synthase domain-containing protein [Bacteroidota bacterium]
MTKLYKRYNLLIQLVILVVSYFFIINQVFWKQDLPALLKTLEDDLSSPKFLLMLALILLLMALNWLIEAWKWKNLISKVEQVSMKRSVFAVLTGVTISSFTPNRIGEYFGRAFILKKASHVEGILITVIGSMSQLLVTIITGSLALLIFLPVFRFPGPEFINGYLYYALVALVLLLDTLLLGLFFNVNFLATWKEKILQKGLSRIRKYFRVFTLYSNRDLLTVMALSFARYIVFSTQYLLLLHALGVNIPFYYAYLMISLIYLIMAIIPTIALTELGIRGSVAIYFFGFYFTPLMTASADLNLGVLAASVLLWVINLGIPAIAGSIFLFRLQFFRNNEA